MSETALITETSAETQASRSTPAERRELPARARKPRRFMAGLRFNGLRYLTLAAALLLAWGFVRLADWEGAGKPESTFLLVLAGGLLAAAAKTGIDILNWAQSSRQAVHVERVHAVQRVFRRACAVREQAVIDWRRIHTILVDNLTGESQEVRLFRDHDETDREGKRLLRRALSEEAWIRPDGVDAVRFFLEEIGAIDYDDLATEAAFLAAFDALLNQLRSDLALASVGTRLG